MDNGEVLKIIKEYIKLGSIYINEPMKNHTYFKIGGVADYLVEPANVEELHNLIRCFAKKNIEFFILGNGTNLLISDKGIRSVVIKIGENISDIKVYENRITVQAGCSLRKTAMKALDNNLTGLEFASGIPGAIGGAVTMNAGAYGGEMKDVIESVTCLDRNGKKHILNNDEMNFTYRKSRVQQEHLIVLEVVFKIEFGNYEEIKKNIEELDYKRISKQPLESASAGSTFKRPEGSYASKLIDETGLRGLQFRGAQVSEKHCGFIINKKDATCQDVIQLIETIQKIVKDKTGYELEPEVKVIGEI